MKKVLCISLIVCAFAFAGFGQKLPKPTQIPAEPTVTQQKTIQEGVALHDAKKFDEAIAKYESVLAANPDCTLAMYELSMTLYAKGDKVKSMEMAYRGSKYLSDHLGMFYGSIANNVDDVGKPDEAMNIYLEAEAILKGYPELKNQLAIVYYNMGVTFVRQKKYVDARRVLKSAVENDYNYASPHYLLSVIFNGTSYPIPAFLAASRFVAIEYSSNRSGPAAAVIAEVLKPPAKDPKTGSYTINLNFMEPKDEGDFGMMSMLVPTLMTTKDDKDKKKTENELFVDAISTIIALASEDKKLTSTFVGKNYVPFMVEMKKNDYVDTFGYMVRYITGHTDAGDWLKAHDEKLGKFFAWAKAYKLPAK